MQYQQLTSYTCDALGGVVPRASTLERFRGRQLVFRGPDDTVLAAASEMAARCIGLILVEEQGRLVGVLTDRDIALRVVAQRRDPETTPIGAVMTAEPATLPSDATAAEALAMMRARGVRRIPLLDGARVAGLVMMEDLIANEDVDRRAVADVARVQLDAEARPAEIARVIRVVREATGLESATRALSALEIVLSALVRRLALRQASELLSKLPGELRERLLQLPPRSERGVTRETVEAELARRLAVDSARASRIADGVALGLRRLVGPDALAALRTHLPLSLRSLLPEDVVRAWP